MFSSFIFKGACHKVIKSAGSQTNSKLLGIDGNDKLLWDIIDVSNKLNKTIVITSVDFAKAFDIVIWKFLFSFLDFGDKYLWLMQIARNNIQSKTI